MHIQTWVLTGEQNKYKFIFYLQMVLQCNCCFRGISLNEAVL